MYYIYNNTNNNTNNIRFIEKYTFTQRHLECNNIMAKYSDRIPIICEKLASDNDLPDIDKHKFLVPWEITVGEFICVIRKRIHLQPGDALFLFVGEFNNIPPSNVSMNSIYDEYKSNDGFLYITYSKENTFG
jgi:GABA(A) receptor-associated protein